MRRRGFIKLMGGSLASGWLLRGRARAAAPTGGTPGRPNILWITCEDMSPTLGCYGDDYARTPNLDRLAAQSVRYSNAYASASVCSPARSCLITGIHATSLGTQNLRSRFPIPQHIQGFPVYLRAAGYFTSNRTKTDYNTSDERRLIREAWTVQGPKGHWRRRKPGQPFFCVFNHTVTHQSRSMVQTYQQFRKRVQKLLRPQERHDPATAPVPPYYPDTPIVRRTVARYYDCITVMDKQVGVLLKQLEEDGLADDTIVFFYSDHGAGMPRHKRLILDSGLRVPLLIRFPKKYQHLAPGRPGEAVDRLVSFVDFPPTVLSLAGLLIPDYMQGQAFLGSAAAEPREHIFGARDRVDEAYDLARCVRGQRYLYVRNFMPHLSYNQPSAYSDQAEIRSEITRLAAEGKLNAAQTAYAGPRRPTEELYDTRNDRHQIHNLADSPEHKPILDRLRRRLRQWIIDTKDVGFLPELIAWQRAAGSTPYEVARQPSKYPLERILAAADLVGRGREVLPKQIELLGGEDAAVRYWAAVGLRALGADAAPATDALRKALRDPSPNVRIEAAAALAGLGHAEEAMHVLTREMEGEQADARLHAARALQLLGETARPAFPAMQTALAVARKRKRMHDMYLVFSLNAALKKVGQK